MNERPRKYGFWSLLKLHIEAWFEELTRYPLVSQRETRARIAEAESRLLQAEAELERVRSGIPRSPIVTYMDDAEEPDEEEH